MSKEAVATAKMVRHLALQPFRGLQSDIKGGSYVLLKIDTRFLRQKYSRQ